LNDRLDNNLAITINGNSKRKHSPDPLKNDSNQSKKLLNLESSEINNSKDILFKPDKERFSFYDNKKNKFVDTYLFCLKSFNEKRVFEELLPGIRLACLSRKEGVLEINVNSGILQKHKRKIIYFLQKGECVFSLNSKSTLHETGDIIIVPESMLLKFFLSN
jgi:hypothetical protein